jgi:hypothetical protein
MLDGAVRQDPRGAGARGAFAPEIGRFRGGKFPTCRFTPKYGKLETCRHENRRFQLTSW